MLFKVKNLKNKEIYIFNDKSEPILTFINSKNNDHSNVQQELS